MNRWARVACSAALVLASPTQADDANFDDPVFCSEWLARGRTDDGHQAKRRCLIAVASTYLDSLLVEGAPGVLLRPDVQRWIDGNYNTDPPRNDGIESLLPAVEEENLGKENAVFEPRRWTVDVDRNEAIVTFDIRGPGFPTPAIVRERFLIQGGKIREIEAHVFNRPAR